MHVPVHLRVKILYVDVPPTQNNCNGCVESETSGRTSIALNFSHQLNPNLVIFTITQKAAQELKVILFRCSMFV